MLTTNLWVGGCTAVRYLFIKILFNSKLYTINMLYCFVNCDVNHFSETMIHKFKKECCDLNLCNQWKIRYFKTIVWFEVYMDISHALHIHIKLYCMTYWIELVESTIPSVQHIHYQSIYYFPFRVLSRLVFPILKKSASSDLKWYHIYPNCTVLIRKTRN